MLRLIPKYKSNIFPKLILYTSITHFFLQWFTFNAFVKRSKKYPFSSNFCPKSSFSWLLHSLYSFKQPNTNISHNISVPIRVYSPYFLNPPPKTSNFSLSSLPLYQQHFLIFHLLITNISIFFTPLPFKSTIFTPKIISPATKR